MRVIEQEHYFYIAWHDEDTDEYFLEALCGTVGQFTIQIQLTPEEIAEFHKNPESMRVLAQSITNSPDSFLYRRIHLNI
jgi:hypothetical protein